MERLATLFTGSFRQLRQVKTVTVCAMLGAIAIVLGSLSIELGSTLRIGFSGIPNEIVHMLFGPVVGSVFAGAMDILKYLIKPTGAFFPGFTLIAMLAGLIYGSFYYKKELSFWRVLAAHVVVAIICNVILNTWCLSILYGKAFSVLLPARLVKNAVMCPIDAFIFYNIAKVLDVTGIFKLVKEEKK